jgi:flavin-dependent dehydrogenase
MERTEVLIVGAGPAGTSTALHLVRLDAAWADRMVVLDRATFPRPKLCGGGLTFFGSRFLDQLGIEVEDAFDAKSIRLIHGRRQFAFQGDPAVRVIRRYEFDARLVDLCRERGIDVRENVAVRGVTVGSHAVSVDTPGTAIEAEVVVGADGSGGRVARSIGMDRGATWGRTLEVLTPAGPTPDPEIQDRMLTVDFTPLSRHGLRGYVWHFPCLVDGSLHVSRGVYECRLWPRRPKADLVGILEEALADRGMCLADHRQQSHPILQWHPRRPTAAPRVLLVGDAAGADALTGEGISFALAGGAAAAESIHRARFTGDVSFADHAVRVERWPTLHQRSTRRAVARWAYRLENRLVLDLLWRITGAAVRDLETARRVWRGLDRLRALTGQR